MRLIDADALKSKMDGYWGRCQRIRKPRNGETAVFLDIKATVEAQPTVDAEPVRHGKWIDEGYYADNTNVKAWHCSECNWHMLGYEDELFRYCPTCGARMVEDDKTD